MKAKFNFHYIFIVTSLVVFFVCYPIIWLHMITTPTERTGSDFIAFYAAGRVAQIYGFSQVYEPVLQQEVQQQQVGFDLVPGQVLLFNHVPYLIPILSVIVTEDYITSFIRWVMVLLIVYTTGIGILAWLLHQKKFSTRSLLLFYAGGLTFFPFFVSLMNGQDTAFLFLGACLWLAGLLLGRDLPTGLGLALTTVRPHIALLLVVPFLIRRRKVLLWFGLGAGILALVSWLIVGVEGMQLFASTLLISAGGEWYGLKEPEMFNLIGLLWRVLPRLGGQVIRWIGWGGYALALVGVCILWARSKVVREMHVGITMILAILVTPHLHYHDLTLLLLPLSALILVFIQGKFLSVRSTVLLPLELSLFLLFCNIVPIVKYYSLYLVMLLLAMSLWFPNKIFHRSVT